MNDEREKEALHRAEVQRSEAIQAFQKRIAEQESLHEAERTAQQADITEQARAKAEADEADRKRRARDSFLFHGGQAEEFESVWPEIRRQLLVSPGCVRHAPRQARPLESSALVLVDSG